MTSFAVGFAKAVHPVASSAIQTSSRGLESADIHIPSWGFEMPAYFATPRQSTRPALVLVVQEVFGVHEHIKDVCRRLAHQGYFAIAPELYARQGNVSEMENIQQVISQIVSKVPDAQVLADLDATVAHVEQSGKADSGRLGITGFCWGGRIVWLYSAQQAKLKAGAAWYGRLEAGARSSQLTSQEPLDVAGQLHGAILGLYGGRDASIPIESIERMRAALARAGKDKNSEIVIYPDAGHAFNADYRPNYHQPSARDAWNRMLDWFRKYGVA